jgi:hypothetical protein
MIANVSATTGRKLAVLGLGVVLCAAVGAGVILTRPVPVSAPELNGSWRGDYTEKASWALRPTDPPPGGWETPWGVDVFFIHPATRSSGPGVTVAPGDPVADERLFNEILPTWAQPFSSAGPLYAPRYRQHAGAPGDSAEDIAYIDILHAFDTYMARDNRGRGLMLVGVDEGGALALRLLEDRFRTDPLASRLAAAYLVDTEVSQAIVDRRLRQPVCDREGETGCILAWSRTGQEGMAPTDRICINPITWRRDEAASPVRLSLGGARVKGAARPVLHPAEISAACEAGRLTVTRPSSPDLSADPSEDDLTPGVNLFYGDLVANAELRSRQASAWMLAHLRRPARPLPAAKELEDAPIHRQDGRVHPVLP